MTFHLLIVDDEPTIRKGLSSFIQWDQLDCVVDGTASDGAEAIEFIEAQKPDLVITDIRMPSVDGIELSRYICEHHPEIKVILLTGYADFQYAQSAIRYSVSDFILKPTSREKLQEAVRRAQEAIAEARNKTMVSKEDFAYLREQFLQELTGMEQLSPSVVSKAEHYAIKLDGFYTAAFQLGSGSPREEGEETGILRAALEKETGNNYVYSYGSHLLVWIVCADTGIVNLLSICREIIETMDSLYAIRLSAGISARHDGLSELSCAVKEAISAGNRNFYEDSSVCVYDAAKEEILYNIDSEFMMDLYRFENCLKNWDFDGAEQEIKALFSKLKVNLTSAFEVKNICVQIYYICTRILIKKGLPSPEPELLPTILGCSTIGGLETLINRLYEREKELLTTRGKEWNPLNEKALRYIHTHLNENLSLETIAAHVHVNPSHLSRIFKKDCGETLTEYINRVRIDKAKELLSDSNALAYEAAETVGFHDPAYFSSIFKKYTGMSPKEYKQANNERGQR